MAWESRRNGRRYFYDAFRDQTGRVRKVYVGTGAAAEEMAAQIAEKRKQRQALLEQEQMRREQYQATHQAVVGLADAANAIVEAALLANGHYRHHRTWRRRGEKRET